MQSGVSSFAKFVIGLFTFISVSFGVTIAVNTVAAEKDINQEAAAALATMLQQTK